MKKYRVIKNPTKKEILLAQIESNKMLNSIPFMGLEYFRQQNEDLNWEIEQIKLKFSKVAEIRQ